MATTTTEHRIRWYARFPGHAEDWMPRTHHMVGGGWGWDVKCSCGWWSRTGGAVERYVRGEVAEHKADVAMAADPETPANVRDYIVRSWTEYSLGSRTT